MSFSGFCYAYLWVWNWVVKLCNPRQWQGQVRTTFSCWWFAWLSSLLRFYWVSISGIELLGVMYLRFPLAHGYFHGKFGAIERLNLLRALTPLLCQSHRDKCFLNFMSSLYIVLFCNFYVTIWCKDNKLIIYLCYVVALVATSI